MADEERALARAETRTADAYEKTYMAGEGTVIYRAKARAHWSLSAIILGSGAAAIIPAILAAQGGLLIAAITAPLMLIIWMLFLVLRVTVSEGMVNVQYGLFGPKIPVGAIKSAEYLDYDWKKFGGWGIRRSLDGEWMYNMPGDGGKAVRIVWTNKGKEKVTWIGTKDAKKVAAAIATATAKLQLAEGEADPKALAP
jgi:hypothetical protein